MRALIVTLLLSLTTSAFADDFQSTFQETWDAIAGQSDCKNTDYPDLVIFTCDKDMALWYFTKPNNAAHPGIVRRAVVEESGGVAVHESGRSYGSDAAQPAFKAWLASIMALDEKVKEDMARKSRNGQQQ